MLQCQVDTILCMRHIYKEGNRQRLPLSDWNFDPYFHFLLYTFLLCTDVLKWTCFAFMII